MRGVTTARLLSSLSSYRHLRVRRQLPPLGRHRLFMASAEELAGLGRLCAQLEALAQSRILVRSLLCLGEYFLTRLLLADYSQCVPS